MALAAVIAVVWVAVQVVGKITGDDAAEPTAATPATTSTTPTPAATTAPPADQVTVALQTAATACDPENVRITPSIAAGQKSGAPIAVDLMISTLDGKACTFQATENNLLVVVDTSDTPIYDSSVCKTAFFTAPVAVPADWSIVTSAQWSGRGSGAGCGSGEGYAPPGGYTFKIGTYGGEPGDVDFTVDKPAPKKTTPTPQTEPTVKPTKSTKPTAKPTASAPTP